MKQKELSELAEQELSKLTDQELLDEAKENKSFSITNASNIGVLMGIVFYSVVKNSWGMLTLIPLYFVYKMVMTQKISDLRPWQNY